MSAYMRWAALAVVTALILGLTLTPVHGPGPTALFSIGLRGFRVAADAAANMLLFMPFGVAAALCMRGLRPIAAAAVLSLAIEIVQLGVPGRYTSPADLVFNTAGAAIGTLLVRRADAWLRPAGLLRVLLPGAALAAALAVLAIGPFLFAPSVPPLSLHGQWTARFADMAVYDGRVLDADVGGLAIPSRRVRDSDRLRASLLAGDTIRVRFQVGSPPPSLAPILSIYDQRARGVVLIGADGHDLRVLFRMRADAFRLDHPDFRFRDALRDYRSGDHVTFRFWRDAPDWCAALDGRRWCGLHFTAGHTWSFLLFPLPRALAAIMPFLWLAALLVPAGFWIRTAAPLIAVSAVVAAVLVATPPFAGTAPTPPLQIAAALAGLAAGSAFGRTVARTRRM